jgi:hypothetical protein
MMQHIDLRRYSPLLLGLVLLASSCAVSGGPGGPGGQSGELPPTHAATDAARQGLAPQLRPFFDELQDYGDWVLVEPQGWVFRPNVNTVAWRPYQDGHWEPSYTFGWVWESNEPFGWITDHYGFWFHDDFQGWLWKPYGAWAPAWVAWVQVGDYVGWGPLAPEGTTNYEQVPDGVFTYVPATALTQQSAAVHANYVNTLPDNGADIQLIDRVGSYRGVHYNAGPDPASVLGAQATEQMRLAEGAHAPAAPAAPRGLSAEPRGFELPALETRTKRVWTEARREFSAARAARTGTHPAPSTAPAAPGVKPAPDSLGTAPGDSLHMRRYPAKPGKPRPPGSGNG